MNKKSRFFVVLLVLSFFSAGPAGTAAGEMTSASYIMTASTTDSTGTEKESISYRLLDAVGQSTPIGLSGGGNSVLHAGFIYQTGFTLSVGDAAEKVIAGLEDMLNDPAVVLTKQETKSANKAIEFLYAAIDAYALYEAGDYNALAKALNKTKSAIDKLLAISVDTTVYQEMLAQAAELGVTAEINRIAALAGAGDPSVIQAQIFMAEGSAELLDAEYRLSVQSFVQAYNEALLAV